MKINWSLRFHNKVWLTTLLAVVCTFVFNLLDLFGIETTVAQEQVMQLGAALLSLLSTLGVVIAPNFARPQTRPQAALPPKIP